MFQVREFLNPCTKSVKSQGVLSFKVAANYFIGCFHTEKQFCFKIT